MQSISGVFLSEYARLLFKYLLFRSLFCGHIGGCSPVVLVEIFELKNIIVFSIQYRLIYLIYTTHLLHHVQTGGDIQEIHVLQMRYSILKMYIN